MDRTMHGTQYQNAFMRTEVLVNQTHWFFKRILSIRTNCFTTCIRNITEQIKKKKKTFYIIIDMNDDWLVDQRNPTRTLQNSSETRQQITY